MGLNHIYKVIWSKTKNAWVVVSEIAKRDGKSSVKSVVTSLAGKSVAAVMVAMVMCGGVASANTVYGPGATTGTSTNVTVVGDNAQVDNYSNNAVVIGSNAKTKNGTKSISIGSDSSVDGQFGIAIGAGAILKTGGSTTEGIVIGNNAKNEYADVVIGKNSSSTGGESTVVGGDNIGVGQYSTIIGKRNIEYKSLSAASPTGVNSILGHSNSVMGQSNTILGRGNIINSNGSVTASGANGVNGNVVIGNNNYAQGNDNIILGYIGAARAKGDRNIFMGAGSGNRTSNPGSDTIAIGNFAQVEGNKSIAMGNMAIAGAGNGAENEVAVAIGYQVDAHKDSLAIGSGYSSSNPNAKLIATQRSINLGYGNFSSDNSSVMIGADNTSGATNNGVVIGSKNNGIVKDRSITIGYNNTLRNSTTATDNAQRIVIGTNNQADGENVVVIGNNINADSYYYTRNAIIIGNNSRYSYLDRPTGNITINGINIDSTNFAGNSSTLTDGSYMSVGDHGKERQIKNVAAGRISSSSTDAVNGSQLYEAVRAVTVGANPDVYMHVNDGTSTQGAGNATSNLGKANEKGGATGNYAIAIGQGSNVKSSYSIGIGFNSVIDNSERSTLIGWGRIQPNSTKATSDNIVLTTGIRSGSNPSQIEGGKNSIVIGTETRVRESDNSTSIGRYAKVFDSDKSTAIGYGAAVKNGDGTFYIGNITQSTDYNSFWPTRGIDSGVFGNNSSIMGYATAPDGPVLPTGVRIIGNNNQVRAASDVMILGNNIIVENLDPASNPNAPDYSGAVILGSNSSVNKYVKPTDATINGDTFTSANYAGQGTTSTPLKDGNIVSVGAAGAERQIKNVAAGEVTATSTDAINGSQLYYVADELAKSSFGYMHVNDGTTTQKAGTTATNYGAGGSKGGATGTKAIAGGVNAQAADEKAIAIGADATASGEAAIAIGSNAKTQYIDTIAIGKDAKAAGNHSVALGGETESKGWHSVSVGYRAKNEGDNSISIGVNASSDSTSDNSTVIGSNSSATINAGNSVILGMQSTIKGSVSSSANGIAIGNGSQINDSLAATAIGDSASISNLSNYGVGIGLSATVDNSAQGIALGYSASAKNSTSGISIGHGSEVSAALAIAIGSGAKASGEKSISIGTLNEVKGNKSSAIGDPSYIDTTATGTHVHGNDNGTATNPIKASESTFMGNTNLAGTAGTTGIHVVGNSNSVDSSNVMVMGNNVTVGTGLDGAVVLGHASSADQYAAATDSTINGVTFEAAGYAGNTGLNKGSIVSVGATGTERQIKNVAAGAVTATSTDAVNGSQLYKTAETILKMPINMAGDSGDTVGLKLGKTVNIKGSVASGADVTDGNIAVVGDKATSTLSLKMAKNLTGLTSGTFTDTTGNQTVINGAGVTVTPTGTGATPISITTSGINAGNQEIKGVKKGTTDDAAVNKKQMDDALAGISSTLTINDGTTDGSVNIKTGKLKVVGESGANALVTTTVSGDTITVGTSTKLQNAVTAAEKSADKDLSNLSATGSGTVKTLAQDAVKVAGTGLATVSDATAAGVKTYTVNVDEGKLVIDDTTGKIGAAGASQGTVQGKDGVATTQNVASVVNSAIDKTKQALDDAKHNFAGDDATVISRKHGEQLNIKGGASTTATDLTSGNIAVVGDTTSGTLNIKMAKALTGLTSATYTDGSGNTQTVTGGSSTIADAAGNSTVVSKGGVTTTDGTNTTTVAPTGVTATDGTNTVKLTGSGIDAGNTQIKNVGKATTDDAAVNKKQMDDALKGATDNTVSLGSESGSTTAKKLSTTGGIKFNIKGETGANALITTSASGDDVTIAPTAKLTAAVTAAEKSADKDLSNITPAGETVIKNLAKTAASWNVETNGAGTTAVAGGDTVNFINGDNIAITNAGRAITIGTAKNVSFDKVTVGGIVLDKTDGINAGNKEIKGVATGTAADSAVNKAQMDAAITAAAGGSLSTETVEAGSTANGKLAAGDTNLASVSGLTGTAKGETYAVTVSENAVKAVAKTAAQDAVKVTGTGLATVSDATAAGVKTYTVNVDEGKLVIDDTTGKLGATGATQGATQGKNGVATTQDVASVVNSAIDKSTQALADAKHNFAGDDATVISRKHGEQLNIKGGASTTATDLTSGNIAVVGDTTTGTLNIKLAKVLTGLTSATYTDGAGNTQTVTGGSSTITDGAGNTTTITKGGMTTTDGTHTTTVAPSGVTATDGTHTVTLGGSGINAGGTEIKNIGKATTDDAAVNKKQMDDAVKAATDSVNTLGDNKVSLGSDSGTTTAKKLSTTGGIKFNIKGDTGANALITTSATGDDVTIAPTAKLTAAVTAAEKSADKDLSNLSAAGDTYIKNLAKTAASWNVETNGAGTTAVAGGDTVNFINGDNIAITNTGRSITIGTAKNVAFDKVTVGGTSGIVIDGTAKQIGGLAAATANDQAVNKGQMDTAIANAQTAATSTEKVVAKTLTGDTNLATVTGQTGTAKGETYEVAVSENAVKAVAQTAAQDAVKVTGTGLATVSDATAAGVKTYTVNVDEGKLVIDDTTGKLGATGATQGATQGKNGVATTQDVASVVNSAIDKTKQALDDAEHKFDGDTGTTSVRKHGEVLSIKGGVTNTADLATGNIGVVSDGAGTLNIRLAKVLSGLTSASFTTAGGDSTVINGGGVTITPSATGASPISMTTAGINAGNKEIKGIANGTTADAAVNKGQLDAAVLAAAGGALSIEKVEAGSVANGKLATGDTNLATVSGLTGATQNETYAVTVSENAVKAVAKTAAQDAVKVAGTGLATVSDATAAGVKTYTVNVDEGKLVIDDTTGKLGATGATQGATQGKNGVATTQDVASVVNSAIDKTKQALDDAKHNFAGDDATVISRKHGEQLNIKGGASTAATDLTSGNIAVVGDTTSGTLNIKLAKVLTGLTSATYTDAAGNTQTVTGGSSTITDGAGHSTVVSKGGVTTTDGTNTTTVAPSGITATDGTHTVTLGGSGINAGGTEIKNIGKATTDDAAVNKKQMDDAVKAATDSVSTLGDNKVSLGSDAGTTTAKKLSTTGGIKFNIKGDTGTNALITTSATGDDVTIAPTAKLSAAVTAAENAANKDLSNLNAAGDTYIKNLAKSAASWSVETNGAGTTAVAGGDTVNFINGDNIAITNTGRSITIGTAKNVAFDKVTVGGVVLDKTDGINAGGKEIKGIANGTTADAAVNKGQLDAAVLAAAGGSLSTEKVVAKTLTGDTNLVTVTGQTGTAKGETYEVAVSENAVKAVAQTAAQDAVKVTGTGLATVTDSTTGGVKTYNVNVDEGKLVIDDTTGKLGATGATQGTVQGKNGVATTQDIATVVNSAIDKTKQALDDAEHKFDGDTGTTSVRKHGEVLSIKGGVTTPADLTTGNIGVVSDGAGTLNIRLAKALTGLTSATYTDAAGNTQTVTGGSSTITDGAGNTTTITKGGVTTTDGTNTTTVAPSGITATDGTHTVTLGGSGINAGGTEIKNIGKATTDDAAVNKKQMDDAVKAATDSVSTLGDNKVSLGSDAGTTTAKKLSTTGGIKFNIKGDTGTNALITTSATGDDVTIAPTAKLSAAVTAAENAADKDLSNISTAGKTVIKNLAATSAQDAVKVTGTGLATVTDSTTGGVKTYNVDVTTGNLVVTATGQVGAAGTTGASGASGTNGVATTQNVASAINDAITKSNANTAQAIADAEHKFDGDTGTTSVRKHGEVLSIKGGVTTPADLTTGNLGVVSDGAGTLNIRLAKVLSGLTSASFTTAGGDTTMINGGGVTITPSAAGATPISITTAGINAGNKEIKGIANGTTADAAVNKGQLDAAVLAAAGGSLSTEKVVAKTLTGDTNLVTVTGQTGTAKGETYEVAVSENAVKAVAQTAAQDAVKVTGTGLATVSDSTTGGVKTYNVDVKTGNLVVTATGQVGAAGTTGAGGASGTNGVATTQNVASAINDAITKSNANTAQAIADAEHKFDGDTGTTSVRKHGEVLSIKGGVTATTDLTTGNIGVVSDGAGTLNIRLAKTLTGLTSAAFTDGTHTVTIAGSGIDAGNTEIKHVGKATTDDAAVNKKQMDDAVKAATDSVSTLGDNKVSLGSDAGTTTAKKLSTTGGIKFNIKGDTGANALITTSASGDDVTIAPTAKLSAAVTAAENSANKDLSNLSPAGNSYIQNLAKSAASWNVETNGAGTTAVAGGDTVNFINGDNIAITNTGRSITIGTAKNVSFDKVTVGGIVLDKNTGIDAGGKEITNVGPATSGNSAVNKTQMDTAITNAVNKATTDAKHDFGGDDTTVVTRKHGEKLNIKGGASTTAADLTAGNIAVLGDAATGTLNIRMAKALTGLSSATFTTPSGTTVINGGGMTITPSASGAAPISITTGGINAGNTEIKNVAAGTTPNSAVNKQQMDSAISNATANVGFNTAGNTGTGSVSNGQTLTITGTNGIETNASGQSITVGLDAATRAQINNATTTANNAAKKDLSNIDNTGKQMIKDTAAWNVKVNSAAAETVKGGDTVTFNDGDNIKVTNTGKDITIATKKDVSFDKVTVGNVVIDKNTHRISGLANAVNNDEAVNLGQMNAAISTVTAGANTIKYKANSGTQNSVALTTGFDFKGDSNIQITADPANSGVINYKLNPALTGITSISGGTGAPTITLNAGSGSNPGNVSINSNLDMGGKQINNIGAATHAGDAVNKAQMDQALQTIAGASNNVAKSYAYKAGAGAAALAALKPIQYDPLEPTQIMAGIGNYKSQTAVALGVAHYTNENTMFNFGVSLDSHDGIVNAGVTHKFGYSPEKKAIPDRYKGGPISSIYVMQDEVTALQAIVQKQAAENEALRQQNEDMQRKVDMILSKIH